MVTYLDKNERNIIITKILVIMSSVYYGIIYRILFSNGKSYIGQTIHTVDHRLYEHIKKSRNDSQCLVYKAMRKYEYSCEIIAYASTAEELNELEIYHIKENNSYMKNGGYNMTLGGQSINGYEFTEEIKTKISESVTEYYDNNPDAKRHLSEKAIQRFENPEERQKCSEKAIQRFENPEERRILSEKATQRFENPEERQKCSERMIVYYDNNPEAKQHLSEQAIKQWSSEEARLEQSLRKKEQYENNPSLKDNKREFYEKNPDKLKEFSQLKKEQIQNNPELHKKMTEASRSNARKKYTRPTFCAYKDIECTDKIGEWDFISDCEKDLVALHLFPNTNSKINEVLKGERKHTHGIYFKYKE